MSFDALHRDPLVWVDAKQLSQQLSAAGRNPGWQLEFRLHDSADHCVLLFVAVGEGVRTNKHHKPAHSGLRIKSIQVIFVRETRGRL